MSLEKPLRVHCVFGVSLSGRSLNGFCEKTLLRCCLTRDTSAVENVSVKAA